MTKGRLTWCGVGCVLVLAGCGDDRVPLDGPDDSAPPDLGRGPGETTGGPNPVSSAICSDLFDENLLVTYEIDIDPGEWALIHDEFVNWQVREANGLDLNPYHPMVLRLGAEVTPAWIRLKGNSSWFSAVAKDPSVKKQFVIAFDQGADPQARFHGVQKVELDMPSLERTFLHERLAQSFLSDVGLPGLCANSARLVVNGAYYGLYANLEFPNKDYLKRVFPGEHQGDLWKKRSDLQTNEDDPSRDDSRQRALWSASSAGELATLMDMEGSLRTWAAEALLPQPDGYWGGNSNFYVYDHPRRGFIWLTDDLDATFEFMPADTHPIYFWLNRTRTRTPGPQYVAVMANEMWRGRFVEILAQLLEGWDTPALQERVHRWAAQIADALAGDPNKPQELEQHQEQQRRLVDFLVARPDAVRRWLSCYHDGGLDADGDGVAWCRDCDDGSSTSFPGAPEVCGDGRDQNCNGLIDDC